MPERLTVFEGRMPRPDELLEHTGRPGCEYLFVTSTHLADAEELGWGMTQNTPTYTVVGPSGMVRGCLVLSKGIPIPGANPANGIRKWYYDHTIKEQTGLAQVANQADEPPVLDLTEPEEATHGSAPT